MVFLRVVGTCLAISFFLDGVCGLGNQQAPLGNDDLPESHTEYDPFRSGEGCPDYRHYAAYPQYATTLHFPPLLPVTDIRYYTVTLIVKDRWDFQCKDQHRYAVHLNLPR